jgi:hypothetical protein
MAEALTYHPTRTSLPGPLSSPFISAARPMFGMPNWRPQQIAEDLAIDPVKKPRSPSRPAQPNNTGTMPTAGRQLAAMQDRKL